MTEEAVPTREALDQFALKVWQYKQGEVVSLMVHLGDRLGLYRALDGAGRVTPAALAEHTGLSERWVREWLLGLRRGVRGRDRRPHVGAAGRRPPPTRGGG